MQSLQSMNPSQLSYDFEADQCAHAVSKEGEAASQVRKQCFRQWRDYGGELRKGGLFDSPRTAWKLNRTYLDRLW